MRYSDLVNFSPIETVIELKDACEKNKAVKLIESYVMSDEMADKINGTILQQLQFDQVVDNKGVLIVGNYGTGKSHLMSVISSVLNDEDNLQYIKNVKFANSVKSLAGRYEVIRIELGAVSNSLRNIVTSEIEEDLENRGIIFSFPNEDEITNNKKALSEMMAAFEEKYPDKGYLLVIDELLDYLGGRKEHELRRDLGFLREIGEFIKSSRFRLICGVQEQLFENPNFAFVSKTLARVKDRFEQVIIRKEDTAYVISERILSKTPEQKALIREHLQKFCSLYSEMSERIDDFVELYPIHPAYIEVFNKVYIAEKREVLKTISLTIKKMLDKEVPEEAPGIISYDSYWDYIKDNYARKSEVEIKEVMDKSAVLEDKVTRAFPKRLYKGMALQIIKALSVYRLTTSGIDVKIGLSAENLRDDLCLFNANIPDMDSESLLSAIQIAIKETVNLVSGQFIDHNTDNGQYYLNLKKDIDYDAKIAQKADMLSDDELNRYFYTLVYDCLDWEADQYVANFEIYEYRLNWLSHNVFRRGYLFMGLPKERSTAQPPEDFYLYMLPPYGDDTFINEKKDDEVMFKFKGNDSFNNQLKLYGASLAMKELAADQNIKGIYNKKSTEFKKKLYNWLNENKNTCFNILYKGIEKKIIEVSMGKTRKDMNFKDTIDMVASITLDEYFENKYPKFPKFRIELTEKNRASIIERVIKYFAGQKSQDSFNYLDDFNLIERGNITVNNCIYAKTLVKKLSALPKQGIIDYSDIITERYGYKYDKEFNIDFEYFTVVLLALVYCGKATLTLKNGSVLIASNLDTLVRVGISDIYDFKYIGKPRQAAIDELRRLFEILELPTGLVTNPNEMEKGLTKLLSKTHEVANNALNAKTKLNQRFILWGDLLIPEHIMEDYKSKISVVLDTFSNFSNKYNTIAKLNNFNLTMEQLDEIEEGIKCILKVENLDAFKINTDTIVNYIANIENLDIPTDMKNDIDTVRSRFNSIKDDIRNSLDYRDGAREIINNLTCIKERYINYYLDYHSKHRLGIYDGKRKGQLINSKVLSNLRKLAEINSILQGSKLSEIINNLSALDVCYELSKSELENTHICKHCKLSLSESNIIVTGKLDLIESNINQLYEDWTKSLLSALEDPLVLTNKNLLKNDQQNAIDQFIESKQLPEIIDSFFVNTINLLFEGLDTVSIGMKEIIREISDIGPCTVEDLKGRLNSFIDKKIKGKDKSKIRIILKEENIVSYSMVAEHKE
ncbi:DUF6079 family protein [Clostridium celatum]|uniref:DUF6079 family protein n=1 Tax=Clostridium celatum TaxID=36834 RepID=UPI001896F8DF|nr:DUF6079 family protein [Clostridium celatum]